MSFFIMKKKKKTTHNCTAGSVTMQLFSVYLRFVSTPYVSTQNLRPKERRVYTENCQNY